MRTGEYFLEKGLITFDQLTAALEYQTTKKGYIGETLLNLGLIHEKDLLAYISSTFAVQYLSSETLKRKTTDNSVLNLIPPLIAEKKLVFPLKYDAYSMQLTVLTPSPQNRDFFEDLTTILDRVTKIVPVLAVTKSVKAIISKAYRGDISIFDRLFPEKDELSASFMMNETTLAETTITSEKSAPLSFHLPSDEDQNDDGIEITTTNTGISQIINNGEVFFTGGQKPGEVTSISGNPVDMSIDKQLLNVFKIFTSILDIQRGANFKRHTSRVTELAANLADDLKVSKKEKEAMLVAATIHDVGKRHHLTAFDINNHELRDKFIKYAGAARKIFASVSLSEDVYTILENMYETYNGRGYPLGKTGKHIPSASQILLLAHSYDYKINIKRQSPAEALRAILISGMFGNELVQKLVSRENISLDSAIITGSKHLNGLLITTDTSFAKMIEEELKKYDISLWVLKSTFDAALKLKEQFKSVDFILCDSSVSHPSVSIEKLLKAVTSRSVLSHIIFFIYSKENINWEDQHNFLGSGATHIYSEFDIVASVQDLVSRIF